MEIQIRYVQPQDHAAVHDIFMSPHVINGTMRIPYQPLDYTHKRLEPSDDVIKLVAYVQGEVVGYAELITHPTTPRHRHAGEINMLAVHAAWQGKGVGRTLMRAMLDLADNWLQLSRLSLIVWASNDVATRLYHKFGFVVERTMSQFVFREGEYLDACIMARVKNAQALR
jgi:L-phenylalanine/L-methionine N-acetyltransferase